MFRKTSGSIYQKILDGINSFGERHNENHLIVFDKKTIFFLATIVLLFVVLVGLKIQGSSITIWNELLPNTVQDYTEGVIAGKPKSVRSDEWVVSTPFTLSQALSKPSFPLTNETLGSGNVPLLTNLPVKHISTIFRPQHWGYFFLDVERGFAYFWDFKFLTLLVGFFLLFKLLTKNNFWLSAFGSLWIFASSFTQWWYNSAEMMGIAALIFVSLTYLVFSKKKINIAISAVVTSILGVDFILFLYPPFQVQLAYLVLFLLVGYIIGNYSWETIRTYWKFKLSCIFAGVAVSVPALYKFYLDAKETMGMIMSTVYPGSRESIGKGVTLSRYFSGFYSSLLRDGHVPKSFLNASEASNFILLYPLVAVSCLYNFVKRRKNDAVIILMLSYIAMVTFWMKFGFPLAISKATLWSYAPTERCYMGLGLASVILSVVFLSKLESVIKGKKQVAAAGSLIFGLLLSYSLYLNVQIQNYFKWYLVAAVVIIFTLASVLFLMKQRFLFAGIILFMTVGPAIFVNPISIGLQPILGKEVTKIINGQEALHPGSKWAVYGNRLLPNFFVASGARVLDGVKYTPPIEMIKALDPEKKSELIWNRYAHTFFDQEGITTDQIKFDLIYADLYKVNIDPCNPKLKQLGVTHLAFDKKPADSILSCATPILDHPISKTWFYVYR